MRLRNAGSLLCLAVAFFLTFATTLVIAQNENTGEIKGGVTDPAGAFVSDVAVAVTNVQTGVVTTTRTNGSGLYDVPFLAPGSYKIKFSKQGFRDFVREGIILQIETLQIGAALRVGTATEEVLVSGAPPFPTTTCFSDA